MADADTAEEKIETQRVELVEETVVVTKRSATRGTVSVRTITEEFNEEVAADLTETKAVVERVAINRIVDETPQMRTEGDVTIVPVFEEVLVVERRIRLVEELHIRREATNETVRLPVTVRRQRAVVERLPVSISTTQPNKE